MPTEFRFPDVGEGIHEGVIVKWLVKQGENVKQDQNIVQVETDKAVVDIPSPVSGKILKINFKQGETIKVGQVLAVISGKGEKEKEFKKQPEEKPAGVVGELQGESGDWQALIGKRSEQESKQQIKQAKSLISYQTQKSSVSKKYDMYGYISREPLQGIRKTIAQNMINSTVQKAMVTSMEDIDVTALAKLREFDKKTAEKKKIKLTFLPYIIRAVVKALIEHPKFASYIENGEIIIKKYYNIGIAVDTPAGLMVPVIKGCEQKDIYQIAKEIDELAEKARNRKVDIMDLHGGVFTITNYGSVAGNYGTPIINKDESAILGLGRITEKAIPINGKIEIRKILPISLTFDHQIVDGAEAALFIRIIKENLENINELMKPYKKPEIKTINPVEETPKKRKRK
jgi:pyruvate dehydrogenase E2 component (dihydrolipoamide acetyltransferase)